MWNFPHREIEFVTFFRMTINILVGDVSAQEKSSSRKKAQTPGMTKVKLAYDLKVGSGWKEAGGSPLLQQGGWTSVQRKRVHLKEWALHAAEKLEDCPKVIPRG